MDGLPSEERCGPASTTSKHKILRLKKLDRKNNDDTGNDVDDDDIDDDDDDYEADSDDRPNDNERDEETRDVVLKDSNPTVIYYESTVTSPKNFEIKRRRVSLLCDWSCSEDSKLVNGGCQSDRNDDVRGDTDMTLGRKLYSNQDHLAPSSSERKEGRDRLTTNISPDDNFKLLSPISNGMDISLPQFPDKNLNPTDVTMLNMFLWNLRQQQLFQMQLLHQMQRQVIHATGVARGLRPGKVSAVPPQSSGSGVLANQSPASLTPRLESPRETSSHFETLNGSDVYSHVPPVKILKIERNSDDENSSINMTEDISLRKKTHNCNQVGQDVSVGIQTSSSSSLKSSTSVGKIKVDYCHGSLSLTNPVNPNIHVDYCHGGLSLTNPVNPNIDVDYCHGGLSLTNPVNPMIAMVDESTSRLLQQRAELHNSE